MTGNYGVPFNLSAFDWSVNKACEPDNVFNLAEDLRHQLIVQKFSYRVTRIMSGNSAHPFGIPSGGEREMLMNMLETEFNAIDNQLRGKCNGTYLSQNSTCLEGNHRASLTIIFL